MLEFFNLYDLYLLSSPPILSEIFYINDRKNILIFFETSSIGS
ncbi:MAG: hypothetical protein K0S27_477 [Gammaproteobacteria bacterium]|jgi:hypothetical protein|nr:hypothetical protein [Gammaproteobacteria bacterium]